MPTTACIISDVRLYREGLALVLASDARVQVVGTAVDQDSALGTVRRNRPQVVLVDTSTQDALAIVRAITALQLPSRIVALTVDETESQVLECVEAGIAAYLTRDGGGDQLVETIEAAGRGELRCSPQVAGYLMRRVRTLSARKPEHRALDQLTARQRDVLSLLGDGLSNKEIARALHIEVATVKNHVHHILEKLQVQRRAEAMALLHRLDEAAL